MTAQTLHEHRASLRSRPSQASERHRILVIRGGGTRARNRQDIALIRTLQDLGHTVMDLDVGRHPGSIPPANPSAGRGRSVPFRHGPAAAMVTAFAPQLVLFAGDGLIPDRAAADFLREAGAVTVYLGHPTAVAGVGTAAVSESRTDAVVPRPPLFSRADLLVDPLPPVTDLVRVLTATTATGTPSGTSGGQLASELLALVESAEVPVELAGRVVEHLAAHHLLEEWLETVLGWMRDSASRSDAQLQLTGSGPVERPRTVLFSGYYGAGNRGDELLLQTLVSHLRTAVPSMYPIVAAADAPSVERTHGLQAFPRVDLTAVEEHAARATAVILGPGGHWHDYSIAAAGGLAGLTRSARVSPAHMAQLPVMVKAYGGSVIVAGMGVGPLVDPAARAAVNLTGQLAGHVSVRDTKSQEVLEPLPATWPVPVHLTPDLVYGLPLPSPGQQRGPARRQPYLIVNLRPWEDADGQQQRALIDEVLGAAANRGLDVLGLPMQNTDVPSLEALAAAAPAGVTVELLDSELALEELLDLLRGAEALVSMRLHANLLMHRVRRPAVGLAYDPKVSSHFIELGRSDAVVDLQTPPAHFREVLERVLDDPHLSPETESLLDTLEHSALDELDRIASLLKSMPRRDPDPAWIQHDPPAPSQRQATPAGPARSTETVSTTGSTGEASLESRPASLAGRGVGRCRALVARLLWRGRHQSERGRGGPQ